MRERIYKRKGIKEKSEKMNIKNKKIIICASALLIVSAIFSGDIFFVLSKDIQSQNDNALYLNNGNTLYVGGSGPGNYTKIQDAINDSKDGDTVFVYDDSSPYYESGVIDKSINFLGENKETTIIDGRKDKEETVVMVEAPYVNISHFTIAGNKTGDNRDFIGIGLKRDAVAVTDCNLHGFVNAILSNWYVANHVLSNCKIWDCTGAIDCPCGDFGEVGSNIISNCEIDAPSGVWINFNTIVSNCTFHNSKIVILDGSNNTLLNNHFNNGYIQIEYSSHTILKSNTLEDSGLIIFGHGVEDFHHDIDASNTMQGKPIYYFYNKKDMVIDKNSNTGYIILALCQNITVKNLDLYGSVLAFSFNNTFENCSFYENSVGLYLHNSTCNSILRCNFENRYPLMIEQSCKNNISYCTFSRWVRDIQIWHSS
ncbi:MAG: hypothetical protein U9O65_08565, partial [Thermotogota bacterium]|nr:hypothetical protein [Thermotogota bacterium]